MALKLKPEDKLLKPYLDSTFKAIFASETEEANTALCDFLAAAIGREIEEITLLQNEPPVASAREKQIRYDIRCQFKDGELANVEMQVNPVMDFQQRMEYYASKLLLSQEIRGDGYEFLRKCYQISLLINGETFDDERVFHRFRMYDKELDIELDGNIVIITGEASKLKLEKRQGLSKLEKWLTWFKEAENPDSRGLIEEIIEGEEGLEMATKALVKLSWDGAARRKAEQEEKILLDYQSDMWHSKQQGIEQGIELRNMEIARNMIKAGIDLKIIAQTTGLSIQEINALS